MTKTPVVFSPEYLRHNPGRDNPENARRLAAILAELRRTPSSRRQT